MRISLEIHRELGWRADWLLPYLQSEGAVRSRCPKYRRKDVLRMAIIKGMDVLEEQLEPMGKAGREQVQLRLVENKEGQIQMQFGFVENKARSEQMQLRIVENDEK